MNSGEEEREESFEFSDPEAEHVPGKENGPVALKSVRIDEINVADTTYQFRFASNWKVLREGLSAHGQLNPIKLIAGDGAYIIVDGHTRVKAALDLSLTHVSALLYKGMSSREAKALSYQANVSRRNLTAAEKANAMQDAVNDGFSRDEVAKMFDVSRRTLDRNLELPEALLRHVDCTQFTMGHGRILKLLVSELEPDVIVELVDWVKNTRASQKELKDKLKKDGVIDSRSRQRKFGSVRDGQVRFHGFKIGQGATPHDRENAVQFLEEAIQAIKEMGPKGPGTSEI